MSIWCKLRNHEAGSRIASNGQMYFGWCSRCDAELLLSTKGWQAIPKGFRVVWKRRDGGTFVPSEEQLELALPKLPKRPVRRTGKRLFRKPASRTAQNPVSKASAAAAAGARDR